MSERVAIVGSRQFGVDYRSRARCFEAVRDYVKALPEGTTVISGGGGDVDLCAEETAKARGLATEIYHADWKKHGRAAGLMRNHDIVANADRVVAFWDGKSKGTAHTIRIANQADLDVEIHQSGAVRESP